MISSMVLWFHLRPIPRSFWWPSWDPSMSKIYSEIHSEMFPSTILNPLWVWGTLWNSWVHVHLIFGQPFQNLPAINEHHLVFIWDIFQRLRHFHLFQELLPIFAFWLELGSPSSLLSNLNSPPKSGLIHMLPSLGSTWSVTQQLCQLPIILLTWPQTSPKGTPHVLRMQSTIDLHSRTVGIPHFPPPLHSLGFGLWYLVDRLV